MPGCGENFGDPLRISEGEHSGRVRDGFRPRRQMARNRVSRGDILVFIERPFSAVFVGLSVLLIALQIYVRIRGAKAPIEIPTVLEGAE